MTAAIACLGLVGVFTDTGRLEVDPPLAFPLDEESGTLQMLKLEIAELIFLVQILKYPESFSVLV